MKKLPFTTFIYHLLPPPRAPRFTAVANRRTPSTRNWGRARNPRDQGKEKKEETPSSPPIPSLFPLRAHHFRSEGETSGNEAISLIFVFTLRTIFKTRFTFLRCSFNLLGEKLTGLLTFKLFDSFPMIGRSFPFEENKSVIASLFHTFEIASGDRLRMTGVHVEPYLILICW